MQQSSNAIPVAEQSFDVLAVEIDYCNHIAPPQIRHYIVSTPCFRQLFSAISTLQKVELFEYFFDSVRMSDY